MILENLETEHLIRIANIWAIDNWERYFPEISDRWDGFDLVGDKYIFQLSHEGTIRIFLKKGAVPIHLEYDEEDCIREMLNEILRQK
jgi:hypothetical protein